MSVGGPSLLAVGGCGTILYLRNERILVFGSLDTKKIDLINAAREREGEEGRKERRKLKRA